MCILFKYIWKIRHANCLPPVHRLLTWLPYTSVIQVVRTFSAYQKFSPSGHSWDFFLHLCLYRLTDIINIPALYLLCLGSVCIKNYYARPIAIHSPQHCGVECGLHHLALNMIEEDPNGHGCHLSSRHQYHNEEGSSYWRLSIDCRHSYAHIEFVKKESKIMWQLGVQFANSKNSFIFDRQFARLLQSQQNTTTICRYYSQLP